MVGYLDIRQPRNLADAGIAWRHKQLVAQRTVADGPGQGMFTAA